MESPSFSSRILFKDLVLLLMAGVLGLGWAAAQAQTVDDVFGSQAVIWSGIEPNSPALIRGQWISAEDNPAGINGRKFVIDLTNPSVETRGSWLVDTNLDLSNQKSFRFYLYANGPGVSSIEKITIYMFGVTWSTRDYSFTNVQPGLNVIDVNRDDFKNIFLREDSWSKIRQIKVSVWRKTGGNGLAEVTMSALQSPNPVQTLDTIFNGPAVWEGTAPVSVGILKAYQGSNDGTTAYGRQFVVDFRNPAFTYPNEQRGTWSTATDLNLSGQKSIKLQVNAHEGGRLYSAMTLYFLGPNGSWKDQTFSIGDGTTIIEANLDRFKGGWAKPQVGKEHNINRDDWHNIKEVRVSLWKREPGRSSVNVRAAQLPTDVAIDKLGNGTPFVAELDAPGRREERNAANELLESRMIFDAEVWLAQGVTTVLKTAREAGFNVYMPSAWLGGGRNYRTMTPGLFSFDVPIVLRKDYKTKIKNDDPLAQLITVAHLQRMEVHPSFSIANRYDGILPQFSEADSPIATSGQTAFELHNPQYREFIAKLIVDFVKNYDVDGINLDYIRTMGMSFSTSAKNEYARIYGSDMVKDYYSTDPAMHQRFLNFQAFAVNDVVKKIHEGIRALQKPRYIVISVAGSPWPKPANAAFLDHQGRNEWYWVENNWVDVVYDMDYARNPSTSQLSEVSASMPAEPRRLQESWAKLLGNEEMIDGQPGPRLGSELATQIDYFIRKHPGRGIGVYHYQWLGVGGQANVDQVNALRNGPFNEVAYPMWWVHKQEDGSWVR